MWKMILLIIGLLAIAIALTIFKSSQNTAPPAQPESTSQITSSNPPIPSNPSTPSTQAETDFPKTSVFVKNLQVPWAIAFLPDNGMLVTEREGRVRFIDKDGNLRKEPVAIISEVRQTGEGGLHGITLHPQFTSNKFVYVYYTYAGQDNTLNRVSRFTFDGNTFADQKIIFDQIPGASNHDGGRIKFGPDRFLYITTGDVGQAPLAQDRNSLAGKILRVTDEGQPAPGNPFGTRVYSYGHRNPQGITWDSQGKLWATEHGRSGIQSGLDELNLIEPGKNYGWPNIQGDEKKDGMVTPILNSGPTTTWAPAGLAYYSGSLYFGGLRGQILYEYVIDSKELKTHFKGEFGRIRDVVLGPDNMLYITTSNRDGRGNPTPDDDRIIRVNPEKL